MKPSYSYCGYLLLTAISMFILKDLFTPPHGIIILVILAISSFMALYVWLNWNRGINRYRSYIGWYFLALYSVTIIFLPTINSSHELNNTLFTLLLCVAIGIMVQSFMVFGYVRSDGYPIPSGNKYLPNGSDGKPLTLKESLYLLSKITGVRKILLPDDARQISEVCFYYPSALSIIGSIIQKNLNNKYANTWSLHLSFMVNRDREKYASCGEENEITFSAIDIALNYYTPEPYKELFLQLHKFDTNDVLNPSTLEKPLDQSIEDLNAFLSYVASYSLLRFEDGNYYLPTTTFDYLQFHKKAVPK